MSLLKGSLVESIRSRCRRRGNRPYNRASEHHFSPVSPTATVQTETISHIVLFHVHAHRIALKAAHSPRKRHHRKEKRFFVARYTRRIISSSRESIAIACQHASLVSGAESPDLLAINPLTFAINLSESECTANKRGTITSLQFI